MGMRAKIRHRWGDWEYYFVGSVAECRNEADRSAYEALQEMEEK